MGRKPRQPTRTHFPFVLCIELYTNKCFVDKEIMRVSNVGVLKGSFKNDQGEQVVVHVPIVLFFSLHMLNSTTTLTRRATLSFLHGDLITFKPTMS